MEAGPIDGAARDRVLYVRLPGNPILGEGKPENQNHAIVFTRGEHLQTLDMNQDNYMGESFKMRNLLERFTAGVRIVGFREHIFSESGGAVAHFAASNEFVFGTMVQRFLTWPLMVRFHYGHPDVWDKVWAISSGGISKASRTLHVSEDIFGGVNVVLRGGSVEYEEYILVGKARDITFAAAMSFEQKISGGNALQCMSRDFSRLGKNCDIFRLLSMFNSGSGAYLQSVLMLQALRCFVFSQLLLAMCGVEVFSSEGNVNFDTVGAGDSQVAGNTRTDARLPAARDDSPNKPKMALRTCDAKHTGPDRWRSAPAHHAARARTTISLPFLRYQVYAAEWFISLGLTMIWPLFLEHAGHYGVWKALSEVVRQQLMLKVLFTLFQVRDRARRAPCPCHSVQR